MSELKQTRIHATAVAWQGCAALLLGPSGSGKSSVALQMIALGCELIADDQCDVSVQSNLLKVACPKQIKGRIEARQFGLLDCKAIDQATLVCVVDLGKEEEKRLPEVHSKEICGVSLRLFHNPGIEVLSFMLLQYLKGVAAHS